MQSSTECLSIGSTSSYPHSGPVYYLSPKICSRATTSFMARITPWGRIQDVEPATDHLKPFFAMWHCLLQSYIADVDDRTCYG